AVVAVGFAFTSCKKDCVCTTTDSDGLLPEASVTTPDVSKSDCEAMSITVGTLKTECKSK
ncbi:MAG: hypothetical protein LBH82_05925, partial [Bacteroidales bacterium]|nr:hypothetical protein [Bacteroidales bacterium]